jgi:hypothetical protein
MHTPDADAGTATPEERGQRWLQAQVQQLLAAGAVALAPPCSEDDTSCYWGTGLESTTLYVRLAGDPEPKALRFPRALLRDCGGGWYFRQHQATAFIRRALKRMGIVST